VSEAKRAAYRTWFALFGAHNTPGGRLLCMGCALLFLAFPLADLASGRLSRGAMILAAGCLAAFAAAYLRLFWILPRMADERRTEGLALLAAVAVLAVVLGAVFGQEWLGLLVYLSVAAALTLPPRIAIAGVVGATVAALAIVGGLDDVVLQTLLLGLLLVAVRRLMELVWELEATRDQAAALAVSEERLRLARDLHDLLGRNLSVIALKSELARKLLARDLAAAEREVRDVEAVARESLHEARAAVLGLRRPNLRSEIDQARDALMAAGIEVTVRTCDRLPAAAEAPLAFAVREATTNVLRHSRARHCDIALQPAGDHAVLEIRDDGIGAGDAPERGSGLRGLAERMTDAGGTLQAGPASGGGFRLVAAVPVRQPDREVRDNNGNGLLASR
jgi:two-component system, NarL family, sensor histidine kinase DesK